MQETENKEEEKSFKKKKKFVYLDKYETYKELTDDQITALQRSVNFCYVGMGIIAFWLLFITLK